MIKGEHGPTLRVEDPDDTRARLALVRARLVAHGMPIPPGRLARFEALSEGFAAKELSPAHPQFSRALLELLEGNRDFHEFAVIVEHLLPPAPPADPVVLDKLRLVLGGAPFPSEDANSLARNTQFELYVAALCARGGLTPRFREPDCVVTAAGVRLGIAAKRAGSAGHVRRLVKDGARQLRKEGLVGVVALSFDRLFRPNDERIFGSTAEAIRPEAPRILNETVRPFLRALDQDSSGSPALAVFAFLNVPAAVPRENHIGRVHTSFLHEFRHVTRAQRAALELLYDSTSHLLAAT